MWQVKGKFQLASKAKPPSMYSSRAGEVIPESLQKVTFIYTCE
jgi:hypothetical protein